MMTFGYRVEAATMRYSRDAGRSTNRILTFGEDLLESLLDKRVNVLYLNLEGKEFQLMVVRMLIRLHLSPTELVV